MREISLREVLDARERRAWKQQELLREFQRPVLSFTMNIPGPVKDSPLIRRGFAAGLRRLDAALDQAGFVLLSREETLEPTGCELLCAVEAEAAELKRICLAIEEHCPLGRLFDMDVIGTDGHKLARQEERCCLVCGRQGRGCASRRIHSLTELDAAVGGILRKGLLAEDADALDVLATKALLDEVDTTPKPGLVDKNNNGSHRDMSPESFRKSAAALRGYWESCFLSGEETSREAQDIAFAALRKLGLQAEDTMFRATGGVNTHKGAIFTLGTLCGAIGRLWRAEEPCRDAPDICAAAGDLCRGAVNAEFAALDAGKEPRSAGERLYLFSGIRGIRGEAAAGFPSLLKTALPQLEEGLARGLSRNDAGVAALLHLIALGQDSNMQKRGGIELAAAVSEELREALARDPFPVPSFAEELDRDFIRQNLSPGGCADLLAAAYFLRDWKEA